MLFFLTGCVVPNGMEPSINNSSSPIPSVATTNSPIPVTVIPTPEPTNITTQQSGVPTASTATPTPLPTLDPGSNTVIPNPNTCLQGSSCDPPRAYSLVEPLPNNIKILIYYLYLKMNTKFVLINQKMSSFLWKDLIPKVLMI